MTHLKALQQLIREEREKKEPLTFLDQQYYKGIIQGLRIAKELVRKNTPKTPSLR